MSAESHWCGPCSECGETHRCICGNDCQPYRTEGAYTPSLYSRLARVVDGYGAALALAEDPVDGSRIVVLIADQLPGMIEAVRADEREKAAQIAEELDGHPMAYIAARIRTQGKEQDR